VMTLFCIEEKRFFPSVNRNSIKSSRWQNVHNDVKVIFWVEADLLDIDWNICDTIQWKESDFVILSVHKNSYSSDIETITQWLVNAIKKHSEKIKIIWHSYDVGHSWDIDMIKLVEVCNEYNIALELNGKSLLRWDCDISKLEYMLKNANNIYVNSDWHSLYEMVKNREAAWNYLRENGYIN
jgi:histidinol phosphatase-like PHP family hydrolase